MNVKIKNFTTATLLSLSLAACYLIGFIAMFIFFTPLTAPNITLKERFLYVMAHKLGLQIWYMVIYIVFALLLLIIIPIIKDRLTPSKTSKLSAVFGTIWASFLLASGFIFVVGIESVSAFELSLDTQITIWSAIGILQNALGGGTELLGGFWVFLIGCNVTKEGKFKKIFKAFSLFLGLLGIVSIFPFLFDLVSLFGVLQIVWFVMLAVFLNQQKQTKLPN